MNHKLESRLSGEISTPWIYRWYHSNDRKWRGTKEPFNEGERAEWKKASLKCKIQKTLRSWHLVPTLYGKQKGKKWKQWQIFFSWAPKLLQTVPVVRKLKTAAPWKKSYKTRQCTKKQRHYFLKKDLYSQSYGFSSSHVWMWELDHKESLAPKNLCFWTVVLEKTLESPLAY